VWAAARHGLTDRLVDPAEETRRPAWSLVGELVTHVRPALEETGDLDDVIALLAALRAGGTGSEQQCAAAAGGTTAMVRWLTERTVPAGNGTLVTG
jgi:carboxylate-amine ligase